MRRKKHSESPQVKFECKTDFLRDPWRYLELEKHLKQVYKGQYKVITVSDRKKEVVKLNADHLLYPA